MGTGEGAAALDQAARAGGGGGRAGLLDGSGAGAAPLVHFDQACKAAKGAPAALARPGRGSAPNMRLHCPWRPTLLPRIFNKCRAPLARSVRRRWHGLGGPVFGSWLERQRPGTKRRVQIQVTGVHLQRRSEPLVCCLPTWRSMRSRWQAFRLASIIDVCCCIRLSYLRTGQPPSRLPRLPASSASPDDLWLAEAGMQAGCRALGMAPSPLILQVSHTATRARAPRLTRCPRTGAAAGSKLTRHV